MNCKKCGNELNKKAVICPNCGYKVQKPIYSKWWFWLTIVLVIIIVGSATDSEGTDNTNSPNSSSQTASTQSIETKEYEKIELQTMIDDLNSNAIKAEKTYNNKYVEIKGRITNFDSDGSYISIESVNADEFNFDTVLCRIKNEEQLNYLLEKSTGDTVTVKGKITAVGEVLGYTISIAEIQ